MAVTGAGSMMRRSCSAGQHQHRGAATLQPAACLRRRRGAATAAAAAAPPATWRPGVQQQQQLVAAPAPPAAVPEVELDEPSTSGRGAIVGWQRQQPHGRGAAMAAQAAALVVAQQVGAAVVALHADAAETLPPEAVHLFHSFLERIDALGPWGAVLFVAVVATAEMVPLLPTQPLTLASGLLFGPVKGAALIVLGTTLAAVNASSLARGVGRRLAERVIAHEVGGDDPSNAAAAAGDGDGSGGSSSGSSARSVMAAQLAAVNRAIEEGGFARQAAAVALLRLTPIVPFSASNYLLGLTPVGVAPLVAGTVAGMSVWALAYASLGGAGRVLLDGGVAFDVLLAELAERAARYSQDVAIVGLAAGLAVGAGYVLTQRLPPGVGLLSGGGAGAGGLLGSWWWGPAAALRRRGGGGDVVGLRPAPATVPPAPAPACVQEAAAAEPHQQQHQHQHQQPREEALTASPRPRK